MEIIYSDKNNAYCMVDNEKIKMMNLSNDRVELYDLQNSFDIDFHVDDVDNVISVLNYIKDYKLDCDVPEFYKSRFKHKVYSNHVNRLRIPYIIELISNFTNPLDNILDSDNPKELLNKTSLVRLVVIHGIIKKRKESQNA